MRIAYSLGSLLTVNDVLDCADHLLQYNPDTIWIPETWGMENFSMLSALSQKTKAKIASISFCLSADSSFSFSRFSIDYNIMIQVYNQIPKSYQIITNFRIQFFFIFKN